MDSTVIGKRIQYARRAKGLSQAKLAEICDLTPKYISNLETGSRQPKLATLIAIANALDCDANSLLVDVLNVAAGTGFLEDRESAAIHARLAQMSPADRRKLLAVLEIVMN